VIEIEELYEIVRLTRKDIEMLLSLMDSTKTDSIAFNVVKDDDGTWIR